ncbi:hypothetical protein MUN74_04210 [Agromyces endophyticus]|uniref:hypothetical protein n=1 Tax=Agromyces sp. H17E-10 TaxID=2932244 RepID=UPI001FD2DA10|nr:hypothetical protein [Agromyces sp. H17E-10]UOQ90127.1 hypothetical protein MUN74_04210 [Agromyces sp. H17E-10]
MTVGVRLIVDVANVMGSKPDGWWRDRARAATRLLGELPQLLGRTVELPHGEAADEPVRVDAVVAVVEGAARSAEAPAGIELVRATADGDAAIVEIANVAVGGASGSTLVVTADRGLRARLDPGVRVAGPGWLNALIGR